VTTFEYSHVEMPDSAALKMKVRPVSRLFRALGDDMRVRIVGLLSHGELCVCHLQSALELTQPTVSRHMAVLRNAGVVEARREGSWVYYRLARQADGAAEKQLTSLVRQFGTMDALHRDIARLLKVRGPGACK
jgi:ArsR family transcriptional regulator